jgi:hypothetical protein
MEGLQGKMRETRELVKSSEQALEGCQDQEQDRAEIMASREKMGRV